MKDRLVLFVFFYVPFVISFAAMLLFKVSLGRDFVIEGCEHE